MATVKNGLTRSGTIRPMAPVLLEVRPRAIRLGKKSRSAIACSTRLRVAGRTPTPPLMTRDTVIAETPALLATSRTVAVIRLDATLIELVLHVTFCRMLWQYGRGAVLSIGRPRSIDNAQMLPITSMPQHRATKAAQRASKQREVHHAELEHFLTSVCRLGAGDGPRRPHGRRRSSRAVYARQDRPHRVHAETADGIPLSKR